MEAPRTRIVLAAYLSQKGLCPYCRGEVTPSNATWEHIIPRAWGGPNVGKNIILACEGCNSLKSEIESFVSNAFDKNLPLTSKAALFILHCSVRCRTHKKKAPPWKVRYFRMAHHMMEMVDYVEANLAENIPHIPGKLRSKFF